VDVFELTIQSSSQPCLKLFVSVRKLGMHNYMCARRSIRSNNSVIEVTLSKVHKD
jgi:hypothetical protein